MPEAVHIKPPYAATTASYPIQAAQQAFPLCQQNTITRRIPYPNPIQATSQVF